MAGSTTGSTGWSKEQVLILGGVWPTKHGWIAKLVGTEIADCDYELFLSLRNKKNNYHPKASLDTNPGEGAAKQSGAASSTLCEVGIEANASTNAVGDRTSHHGTPFNLPQFRQALKQVIDSMPDHLLIPCLDIANNKLWEKP